MKYCLLLALPLLAACNPYQQFYKPNPVTPLTLQRCLYNDGEPEIRQVAARDARATHDSLIANGYYPIGYSNFNAAGATEGMLRRQAKKVRAYLALYSSNYSYTENGAMPITTPTVNTSYGSGTVSVGATTASYSGTATTYGSTTSYVPYSVNRYDYSAAFFGKRKHGGLGVMVREPTPAETVQNGTNQGLVIFTVVKGEAAFNADLLVNDTILTIGGDKVNDSHKFFDQTAKYLGKSHVPFEILRKGSRLTKYVNIGN